MGYSKDQFRQMQAKETRDQEIRANDINLPEYLICLGYHVKKTSNNDDFEVKNTSLGKLRLSMKDVWLCFIDDDCINSVQLVQKLFACTRKEAINKILRQSSASPAVANNSHALARLAEKNQINISELPEPHAEIIEAGITYLKSRGIDPSTFEMLRKIGNAQYTDIGLAFVGRKENGAPGIIETRLFRPFEDESRPGKWIKHLVKKYSDRSYAIVIHGSHTKSVEVVEGCFDGMALYEMNKIALPEDKQPTIIIAGGKDSAVFLDNPAIKKLLEEAENITCCGDNEQLNVNDFDDVAEYLHALDKKQFKSDSAHMNRVEKIRLLNPTAVIDYQKPPRGHHDIAEQNQKLKEVLSKVVAATKTAKKFVF